MSSADDRKGLFLVIEGGDGSGKDTQLKLLSSYLMEMGYDVLETSEPTDGPIGRKIRQKGLSEKERYSPLEMQLMFSVDRNHHLRSEVYPALKDGKIVISSRYTVSTLAYSYALGLDVELLESANSGYMKPDLTIYIDVDPDTAIKRIESRGGAKEIYETYDMQRKVRDGYRIFLSRFNHIVIDGSMEPKSVYKRIAEAVYPYLQNLNGI